MRRIFMFLLLAGAATFNAHSQLKIDNAVFFIQSGATVTVQGDVTSNVDIQGTGLLQLKGSTLQNVDMGGFTIPNLELDNAANATLLNTNARIGTNLTFTNGKFQTGNLNLLLASTATITGAGTTRFVWTNGIGQLIKELTANVTGLELPVGENSNYRPAYLTTVATYSSAQFGVRVLGAADANKPPMIGSYLNTNWPVTKSGITGTASLSGQYIDPTDISGTEANLVGYFNSGTDWSSVGETHNTGTNQVGAPVTSASGVVSGFNKFLAVGARAFLRGAYDTISNTGLMSDLLRTLPFGSSASTANFPSTDPYRVAPYSTSFTHVNNSNVETIANASVLDQSGIDNDIVDWVYLELRNLVASPGNTILQTRAALIQRDGDIVDVDAVSPVTFNGQVDGNYILTVRHRNHLGLSLDQTSSRNFTETKSLAYNVGKVADLRTATDPELFGTSAAYTIFSHPTLTTVNLLWGGNANHSTVPSNQVRYSGLNNDRDYILITTLANNPSGSISNVYHISDINMNKVVRYSGLNNDRDFLLIYNLGNNPSTTRTQAIPN